jgi:hypothetical protein
MKWNFLYQIIAAYRIPDLRATAPTSPFSLSSVLNWICWTLPEQNSWVRHWLSCVWFVLRRVCVVLPDELCVQSTVRYCCGIYYCVCGCCPLWGLCRKCKLRILSSQKQILTRFYVFVRLSSILGSQYTQSTNYLVFRRPEDDLIWVEICSLYFDK